MGAKGSREAVAPPGPSAAADKPRAEPTVNVVTAVTDAQPGQQKTAASTAPPPRKNYGAYGCAVALAVQATAKQKQVRESRERVENAAAPAS